MSPDQTMPVLLVDDYIMMLRVVRKLLNDVGFPNVDEANDGPSALLKMQSKKYGLVISDWNMSPMSGHEFLTRVRSNPATLATPFIVITAESQSEAGSAAKAAGANSYLTKPFNADTLKKRIDEVLAA
jgi:two-component system, chemotaxis family, chemotaxis protein CheY